MYFQVYLDIKGEWRWRLEAMNGRKMADSGEGYKRKGDCLDAIRKIKETVAQSNTWDLSQQPPALVTP